MEAIAQVIKGQDIQDGDVLYSLAKSLLKGDALQLNDYLVHFLVSDRATATKISCKEFADVLEDRILYQWKLEFEKEGIDSSSSALKEFLDV
eukprot:12109487-Ditylum_brightwellii.AAC.1